VLCLVSIEATNEQQSDNTASVLELQKGKLVIVLCLVDQHTRASYPATKQRSKCALCQGGMTPAGEQLDPASPSEERIPARAVGGE
jgi:L,D-peptidoglycan transpeptidase YkuD (ErfK/YbiS/YcfS/YnhG family)